VIEFGCGDGNQLRLAQYPRYLGIDVSEAAVELVRSLFSADSTKRFMLLRDYAGETAELALSLDVIYHLVEDQVFEQHLCSVFGAATRFVAIYSTNWDAPDHAFMPHVRHRRFTDFVERHWPDFRLVCVERPPPDRAGDVASPSLAEFHFYAKQ